MKKLNIGILAFSGIVFLNSCGAAKTAGTRKKLRLKRCCRTGKRRSKRGRINLSYMDKTVRPQDDFLAM
jgi:putative endopeptidase